MAKTKKKQASGGRGRSASAPRKTGRATQRAAGRRAGALPAAAARAVRAAERERERGSEAARQGLRQAAAATARAADGLGSREALDALFRSGSAAAKGTAEFGRTWLDVAQTNLRRGMAAAQAIAGSRSFREIAEIQGELVRDLVAESSRLSDMSLKLGEQVARPLREAAITSWRQALRAA